MLKKIIFIILIGFLAINVIKGYEKKNILSENAIRLRIIANSDSKYDQEIKMKVKNKVQNELSTILKDTKNIMETRQVITRNLKNIDNIVSKTLQEENYELGYNINYGYNYFPQKEYDGITFEEGEYESLLITLGEGKGENWWCILFPPLCIIEAEESEQKVEYESFIGKLFLKFF